MNKKNNVNQERIRTIRQKAEETLKLCNEAEQGKISAEEFEKRVSKVGGAGSIIKPEY